MKARLVGGMTAKVTATALKPVTRWAGLGAEGAIHGVGNLVGVVGHQVPVEIGGEGDGGVSEGFLDDLQWHPFGE